MNRILLWAAPISVIAFLVLLAVMYGVVGEVESTGSGGEKEVPELNLANTRNMSDNMADTQQQNQNVLAHHGQTFSAGIGNKQNNQIQLINKPTFPSGIGNGQIQLINNQTFPSGIGNGQIQLINKQGSGNTQGNTGQLAHHGQTFSAGIGNNQNSQIQLINNPTFPSGIGNGQIQLIGQNTASLPYLGINIAEISPAAAKELNIDTRAGIYVKSVIVPSPADKSGIKAGDVILKCDHQDVTAPEQIGKILQNKKVEDRIKVVVNRNGTKKSFQVKLENAPANLTQVAATQPQSPSWMGADIQDIDAVMKMQFNLPDKNGVIVSNIVAQSPAEKSGLNTGDVIKRFGGTRIRDVKQFQELILRSQPGDQAQLTVLRNGQYLTIPVILGQKSAVAPKKAFLGPADVAIEGSWIGMDVTELSPEDAAKMGLPSGTQGILVNDVESPPATMVGFQTGDVIVAVNSIATPNMKQFGSATEKQTAAVVDIIRGNRHIFISVPPPGYTQQGTKINTGLNNKVKQVGFVLPDKKRLGLFCSGPNTDSQVAGSSSKYFIIADLRNNSYSVLNTDRAVPISQIVDQYNIDAVICSDISRQTATELMSKGIETYGGVMGTVISAIGMYESNCLVQIKN